MKDEYRAWHTAMRKMCKVYYINWDLEEAEIGIKGSRIKVPLNSICLMKNTHKQDVSGRDVYEGDFIESYTGTQIIDLRMLVRYGTYKAFFLAGGVYMNNVGFYLEAERYPQMPLGPLEDYAKVIGNMYENAEWLS